MYYENVVREEFVLLLYVCFNCFEGCLVPHLLLDVVLENFERVIEDRVCGLEPTELRKKLASEIWKDSGCKK